MDWFNLAKRPASVHGRDALLIAQKYIGVSENPDGTNSGPLTGQYAHIIDRWLTLAGVDVRLPAVDKPWCAAFVTGVVKELGLNFPVKEPAAVISWVEWARSVNMIVDRPYLGDLVAFSWDGKTNNPNDHIGFVEKVLALPRANRPLQFRGKWFIRTVEGNSSNRVQRCWRWVDPGTVDFLRLP